MAALTTIASILAGVGSVGGIIMGKKQADAQAEAQAQNRADALKTADQADQANNKANAKRPDQAAIDLANRDLGIKGLGSTLLTGPSGVDMQQLKLGKATLLGS